jgi:Rps23 Pro-64 3,4-dihydroxylase Tpa1-like proline 4-hydroxylase
MNSKEQLNIFDCLPPYYIVQDFLGNDLIERLLAYAQARETEFVPTSVGNTVGRIDPEIRVSRVLWDFGILRDELDARFRAAMPQAIANLRLAPFDLARCEIELVAHGDGAFYQRHIDTATGMPDAKTQRALTCVLYFHALPKSYSGGQLRLYSFSLPEAEGSFVDIQPERDQLVLFPAWAPHEVLPVSCPSGAFAHSRFAINCWYRRPNPNRTHTAND